MTTQSLEDMVLDNLAKQMKDSMDFEILSDVFVRFGWTCFTVDYTPPERSWQNMINWVDENCTGEWKEHAGKWMFENEKDATMFALKWV